MSKRNLPSVLYDAINEFGDKCASGVNTGHKLVARQHLIDAIEAHIKDLLEAIGAGGVSLMGRDAVIAAKDAEIGRLREAIQGLLDALPSATTHPAIQAARAALTAQEPK